MRTKTCRLNRSKTVEEEGSVGLCSVIQQQMLKQIFAKYCHLCRKSVTVPDFMLCMTTQEMPHEEKQIYLLSVLFIDSPSLLLMT
ncbi:hypothetical protein ANN_02300 [Periplaneta americana]|uniref:Uncharacterized protein n=1 Tax=Periplaneta americana TaxID=6978 RepID=A0ABQ8TVZ8_PERAM|nr:hypothetical protein ANN_02300 [Periplaneta americana]